MGSVDVESPTTWVPYMSNQDCSQKICNLYCPQWCNYGVLPSPPPPLGFSDDDSGGATLSPLVITIIGVFGSTFLLISYYVIISRLCTVSNDSFEFSRRRGGQNQVITHDLEMSENDFNMEDDPLYLGPWRVPGKGLDEAMIKSIKVCKYKKEDGLVSSTDCPVCLGEFQEDEKLRLLPKCSHAFHVYCIDNWLTSHSNCPLCRASVSFVNAMPHTLPPPPPPPPPPPLPRPDIFVSRRVLTDLEGRDAILDIREDRGEREVRRSISMGTLCQNRVLKDDILFVNHHCDMELEEMRIVGDVGSSKQHMKSEQAQYECNVGSPQRVVNGDNAYFNCDDVRRDMLKRSFSSGRYLFIRGWKGKALKLSSVLT